MRRTMAHCVDFPAETQEGVEGDCVALANFIVTVEQIKIDWQRGRIGIVDEARMQKIRAAVGYVLGL